LGTILVSDLAGDVVAVVEAADRHAAEPWCPIVLITRSPTLSHTITAIIDQFHLAPAMLSLPGEVNLLSPEPILLAVGNRPHPTPEELARYVVVRTERPDLYDTLVECFARGIDTEESRDGVSRSTLSRRLSRFGPLKARDWGAMVRTLNVLLSEGRLGTLSKTHAIDPRTVQAHIHHYTDLTFAKARERPGWEWVVEAALRKARYVAGGAEPSVDSDVRRSAQGEG